MIYSIQTPPKVRVRRTVRDWSLSRRRRQYERVDIIEIGHFFAVSASFEFFANQLIATKNVAVHVVIV